MKLSQFREKDRKEILLFYFCVFFAFILVVILIVVLGKLKMQEVIEVYQAEQVTKDREIASEVDMLIEQIGKVTLDSGESIGAAREAYDALNSEQKKLVVSLAVLENAENFYESLEQEVQQQEEVQISEEQITEKVDDDALTYIIPDSSSKYLEKSELKNLNKDELRLARNEIYARHGRKFDDQGLQAYFNTKSWYRGTVEPVDFIESMLNDFEKKNVLLISDYEVELGYK